MDIEVLRLLNRVRAHGSYAAVSRAHDLDPSQISRAVSQAETTLGFRLFQRSTRQMTLTDQGESFLDEAARIVEAFDQARESAGETQSALRGTVRLTAPLAYAGARIIPRLAAFRDAYPEIGLEVVATDAVVDLRRDEIDLAIRHAPMIEGDLICRKLHDTVYQVCATPTVRDAIEDLSSPHVLGAMSVLRLDLPGFRDRWQWRRGRQRGAVNITGPLLFSSVVNLHEAALAGLGPAMLADWIVERDIERGDLVELYPDTSFAADTFDASAWLIYPDKRFIPARVQAVMDFLRR